MVGIARLGDKCTHGATIITSCSTRYVDNLLVARLGDLVYCPIHGHGINPIISVVTETYTENKKNAHANAQTACGATIIIASPDVDIG